MLKIVVHIAKSLGVTITKNDISTAHRLSRQSRGNKNVVPYNSSIIACFINKNIRKEIYLNCTVSEHFTKNQPPVVKITQHFIYENLAPAKKRFLWLVKQQKKVTPTSGLET